MHSTPFRHVARAFAALEFLLTIVLLGVGSPALCQDDPPPATAQRVAELIDQLNSTRFVERERATQALIEVGGESIDLLMEQLPTANPEVMTRGVYVLSELALSTEAGVAQRSWRAIETLANHQEGTLARRASDSLATLELVRKERAREVLVSNGARVSDRHGQVGGAIVIMVYSVEISDDFKGDLEDLKQIKWLDDVQQVSLRGEKITDEWLAPLADLKNLIAVEVKHSKVTAAGLQHLKSLRNLQYLSVYYSPVSDRAVELLGTMKSLSQVSLFGTDVTAAGAEELKRALTFATIDFRQGAFLGVGCDRHEAGALITIMHEGSAAERAGIRSGDVIQRFDGKNVADFDELKAAIAEHKAGGEVIINVLRLDRVNGTKGTPLEFKVMLGEWE